MTKARKKLHLLIFFDEIFINMRETNPIVIIKILDIFIVILGLFVLFLYENFLVRISNV